MQIKFDDKGYVTGYATVGGMVGAVEYKGDVPADFTENYSCYFLDGDSLIFDETKKAAKTAYKEALIELKEIEAWFNEYDNQVRQYGRCQRLGAEFDRDIDELDRLAAEKQLRVRELRMIVGE